MATAARRRGRFGGISQAEYFGLRLDKLSYIDSTEIGGSSPVAHVGHAAAAIAAGKARVVLITLAGLPRSLSAPYVPPADAPEQGFETSSA